MCQRAGQDGTPTTWWAQPHQLAVRRSCSRYLPRPITATAAARRAPYPESGIAT